MSGLINNNLFEVTNSSTQSIGTGVTVFTNNTGQVVNLVYARFRYTASGTAGTRYVAVTINDSNNIGLMNAIAPTQAVSTSFIYSFSAGIASQATTTGTFNYQTVPLPFNAPIPPGGNVSIGEVNGVSATDSLVFYDLVFQM